MDISEAQLAIDWTLTEQDILFVCKQTRGRLPKICFAADLCCLRAHSHFVRKKELPSLKILNYLAKQLEYNLLSQIPLFLSNPNIFLAHRKIAEYLDYFEFNDNEKLDLQNWLKEQLHKQVCSKQILSQQAKIYLKSRRIILPNPITLGRLLAKAINEAYADFYQSIVQILPLSNLQRMDELLTPNKKGVYSSLAELKRAPANPNPKVMNLYLDYFEQLEELDILNVDLSCIHPDVVLHLAKAGRYYTAYDLRCMSSAPKRYAIVICFYMKALKIF